ncbi:putative membrane protein [Thermocatellispora tengchongensis]|uniref:Putative membrane protein n=1 Tax=Thermocatellispora tengchongensis TaxID=1073253 RepID=A0A840PKD5_9ACTN|nr:DUF2079 domain-containing protein [Thermocatellispora tengchongensis]MBB5136515.1 putative membrane protein [Thermocatellispora tengchongensis]
MAVRGPDTGIAGATTAATQPDGAPPALASTTTTAANGAITGRIEPAADGPRTAAADRGSAGSDTTDPDTTTDPDMTTGSDTTTGSDPDGGGVTVGHPHGTATRAPATDPEPQPGPGPEPDPAEQRDQDGRGDQADPGEREGAARERAGGVRERVRGVVGRVRRGEVPREVWGVGGVTLAGAVIWAVLGLVKLHTFKASTFDLVIFDQAVRAMAHFEAPVSAARGVSLDRGMDFVQLGEHFSPILGALALLYWLHDGPATLIVAQAVLFALATPFIWVFTRRVLGTAPAYLVAVAYVLSWPIAQAANFDFHEVAFAPLLIAIMIERYQAGRLRACAIAAILLLLVKEDMGLLVAGFGAYAFVAGQRLEGCSFALMGLGWTMLVRGFLIPAVGGDPNMYWAYNHLGADAPQVLKTVVTEPLRVIGTFLTPEEKWDTLAIMLWPTLLLCLFSPLTLMAVPHFLERMLSDRMHWWVTDFHHSAFTVVILLCAGVDGLSRVLAWMKRRDDRGLVLSWSVGVVVVAVTLLPRFALDQLAHPTFYQRDARATAAAEAAAMVPSGVVVEAVNSVGPALSGRATVLLLDHTPRQAPWVIADTARAEFPFGAVEQQQQRVAELRAQGYRTVFEREGLVVLHRP